jgi:hypothetical protein
MGKTSSTSCARAATRAQVEGRFVRLARLGGQRSFKTGSLLFSASIWPIRRLWTDPVLKERSG